MSEIIDFNKINGDSNYENLRWAMCEIMAHRDPMLKPWESKHNDPKSPDLLKYEVEMKIDGVEVQFSAIVRMMFEQYDDMCKAKAVELISDKFYEIENKFRDVLDKMKEDFGVQS